MHIHTHWLVLRGKVFSLTEKFMNRLLFFAKLLNSVRGKPSPNSPFSNACLSSLDVLVFTAHEMGVYPVRYIALKLTMFATMPSHAGCTSGCVATTVVQP